jgi:cobalt-zinc-cadmium efflux system protein
VHAHSHSEPHSHGAAGVLRFSLLLTLGYIVLTVVAGIRGHSLALLSEAGHNVSDFLALGLSLGAVYLQSRPPNPHKTFGYQRAGVLAAFVNAVALVVIAGLIFYEAWVRLLTPEPVRAPLMIIVAAIGVAMNGAIAFLLHRSGSDVNIRSALLHMVGDTFSTAAVIVGGWAILATGLTWIDPALSFGIAALILWSSFGIIRETLNILLEGTPRGMTIERVAAEVLKIEGVREVHDLHVWSLGSDSHALSCHIRIEDIPPSVSERILREVQQRLREQFRIQHTTIQFEHVVCDVEHGCVVVPDRRDRPR